MSDSTNVKSFFFVNGDQECFMDCTHDKELVEVCEIVESAECVMDFFNDEFVDIFESEFDEDLYNLAEKVEKNIQIGRGLKRTADDLIQIDGKRRRLGEPSTSGDSGAFLQPPASNLSVEMVECAMMTTNIRGELTTTTSFAVEDSVLIDALATSLNIQSPKKLIEVTEKVFSALLLYAIERNDEISVKKMLDMGADVNAQNSEGKTPLHEAVLSGNKSIVEYMLKNGANVHLKSKCGEPPLLMAVHQDDPTMIDLLLQCGAHLSSVEPKSIAEMLSLSARSGAVKRLECLKLAGADLNIADEMEQTPLHKGVLCNHFPVVQYLLHNGANKDLKDVMEFTALDYAKKLNRDNISVLLEQ